MKNPFINALSATTYITAIVSAMSYASETNIPEDGIFIPIFMLSLLAISVSMMGYFFIYQPLWFLIQGKQKEATKFFFSTIAIFALTTGIILSVWLFLAQSL